MATAPRRTTSARPPASRGSTNGRGPTVTRIKVSATEEQVPAASSGLARLSPFHYTSRLPGLESFLKREEADVIFVAGNVLLVALEIIEWPVAALALVAHALSRSRYKALEVVAEVAEEVR
jgi:hypothetical protein